MRRTRLIEWAKDRIHRTQKPRRNLRPRRCGKVEKEGFPMEKVPNDLHSCIVEKMTYLEFSDFNSCSKVSSEMCLVLPQTFQLPLLIDTLNIRFRATDNYDEDDLMSSSEKLASRLPKNVHYICKKLCINPQYWDIIKDYHISAELVEIYDDEVRAPFVKNILQLTNATELDCDHLDNTALALEEMKQLKSVTFGSSDITDGVLLNLPIPSMNIKYCELKLPVLKQFILQWLHGERDIVDVELEMSYEVQLDMIYQELEKENSISISKKGKKFILCRGEDGKDCLTISQECNMLKAVGSKNCEK